MSLHAQSMFFAASVTLLLAALALGVHYLGNRGVRGLGGIAAAFGLSAFGLVVFWVRDMLDPDLGILLPNATFLVGPGLIWIAMARLWDVYTPRLLPVALGLPLIAMAVFSVFVLTDQGVRARTLVYAAAVALMSFGTLVTLAQALRQHRSRQLTRHSLPVGLVFVMVVVFLRGCMQSYRFGRWWAMDPPPQATFMDLVDPVFLVGLMFVLSMLGYGTILMTTDRLRDRLQSLVATDELTGLFNRRAFVSVAQMAISAARRGGRPVSLLMLDLDHFKAVNDFHGHAAGDRALKCFAAAMREGRRAEDSISRIGGEEFAVLLPDTAEKGAAIVAETIRRATETIRDTADEGWPLTVSIGTVTAWGDHLSMEAMMRAADDALYAAKRQGRNRVVSAEPLGQPVLTAGMEPA
ncbi:GGDEF domain-containing protein [Yunchengibacter salinarum]|uniref:GGDEF domain-containing protein n=1 Tax=Yunchengibacter salinarum TaxID=3133399 RepID=UPI0035B5B33C